MRKTKIVCTIGPATAAKLPNLIKAGMNVARLNFSHGDYKEFNSWTKQIRSFDKSVGILQDLAGPKIRVGKIDPKGMVLSVGDTVYLTTQEKANRPNEIPVNYKYLIQDVIEGESIYFADGLLKVTVMEKIKDRLRCKVDAGGVLYPEKGVNFPDSNLTVTSLTQKDKSDLEFGIKALDVDFIGLSFVRSASNIEELRGLISRLTKKKPWIISKIETKRSLDNIDDIIVASDAIMVARGDLGVETPIAQVPLLQKMLIAKSMAYLKPVIVATEMLNSMISSPRPTRAEVSDVANAVFDGADAVMLSGETAVGKFPIEAAKTLAEVVEVTERSVLSSPIVDDGTVIRNTFSKKRKPLYRGVSIEESLSSAAVGLAFASHAKYIIVPTISGATAKGVAAHRPVIEVIGFASEQKLASQLSVVWGITAHVLSPARSTDLLFKSVISRLKKERKLISGDRVVVTAGHPVGGEGSSNIIKVIKI